MTLKTVMAALLALVCAGSLASPLPDYPFVSASGRAELWLKPDIGELQFEINVQDQQADKAAAVTDAISASILSLLTDAGVASDDIQAFDVSKKALEVNRRAHDTSPLAYVISRHFVVRVRNLQQWPSLISALLAQNNIEAISVAFDRQDRDQVNARLAADAARNARANGAGLAEAFGRKLGLAVAISQGALDKVGVPFGLAEAGAERAAPPATSPGADQYAVPNSMRFAQGVNAVFRIK